MQGHHASQQVHCYEGGYRKRQLRRPRVQGLAGARRHAREQRREQWVRRRRERGREQRRVRRRLQRVRRRREQRRERRREQRRVRRREQRLERRREQWVRRRRVQGREAAYAASRLRCSPLPRQQQRQLCHVQARARHAPCRRGEVAAAVRAPGATRLPPTAESAQQ